MIFKICGHSREIFKNTNCHNIWKDDKSPDDDWFVKEEFFEYLLKDLVIYQQKILVLEKVDTEDVIRVRIVEEWELT